MSFQARFDGGVCGECGEVIRTGELIQSRSVDGVKAYFHERCPYRGRPAEVCATCWLEKPCDCEDG